MPPSILTTAIAVPNHQYTQSEAAAALGYWQSPPQRDVFLNSQIDTRHFALPLETLRMNHQADRDFLYNAYLDSALSLSCEAGNKALLRAMLAPEEIDYLVYATCTGYSVPTMSAHILKAMNLRRDVQRADLYGMGCCAAVPALRSAADYVRNKPTAKALVVVTEVYSTTIYVDEEMETAVGNAIFADSGTAMIVSCDSPGGFRFRLLDFESAVDPDNIDALGYTFPDGRFRIRLDARIPKLVAPLVQQAAEKLLARNHLRKEDIGAWVIHPGGKRILESAVKALGLTDYDLRFTKAMYAKYGNTAAAGVVFVLDEVLNRNELHPHDKGLMLTIGPGLTAEGALIEWC